METKPDFKIGDCVAVKKGVKAPEFGWDISGWQGRIFDILENDQGEAFFEILWDSVTLNDMPYFVIEKYEDKDWEWSRINLAETDVEPAQPRDSEEDVWVARDQAAFPDVFEIVGDEGNKMMEAFHELPPDEDVRRLRQWWNKFRKEMTFPFEARVISCVDDDGEIEIGSIVDVRCLIDLDNFLGVLVRLTFQGETYTYGLSELEPTNPNSSNYQIAEDYRQWFENI